MPLRHRTKPGLGLRPLRSNMHPGHGFGLVSALSMPFEGSTAQDHARAFCGRPSALRQIRFNAGVHPIFWLERFSLSLTRFNLRILQSPLGFKRIRDGYIGSNLVKNALGGYRAETPSIVGFGPAVVFEAAFNGEQGVGIDFRPAALCSFQSKENGMRLSPNCLT